MAKIHYATKTCGRCLGSGSYSYCSMYGSVCFGCKGAKVVLTPLGKKASAAVKGFIEDHFAVEAGTLVAGDRVKVEGNIIRTLTKVEHETHPATGAHVTLHWEKPVSSPYMGKFTSLGVPASMKFTKAVAGADWEKVVAFARTLKGVTVTETEVAA